MKLKPFILFVAALGLVAGCVDKEIYYRNMHDALENPGKVYRLDLRHSHVENIPPEIRQLKNLKYLALSHNMLTSVPKEIGRLKNLKSLGLNRNKYINVPREVCETHNKIISPKWICENRYTSLFPQ